MVSILKVRCVIWNVELLAQRPDAIIQGQAQLELQSSLRRHNDRYGSQAALRTPVSRGSYAPRYRPCCCVSVRAAMGQKQPRHFVQERGRYATESRRESRSPACPLWANSGHRAPDRVDLLPHP